MAKWIVDEYIENVLNGEQPAGQLVRQACVRHVADLKDGALRGLRFDVKAAKLALAFFGVLRHSKGEWAGQPFKLEPWQAFIIAMLFGWKRADGTRRFRNAYIEVPRKNGKSTLVSGIGLYLLAADSEPGAEVYSAATKRDQARITHGEARRMVKSSPLLRKEIGLFKDNLHVETTNSKYEPLGADADTMDGLNVHGAIIDELHAHKTRDVVDVLDTATGARRQPLTVEITTAGYDQASVCYEHHDYSRQVLAGTAPDDTWFAFIATVDEGDNWQLPEAWMKANPNYGVSVKPDDLARKAKRAASLPAQQNAFKRLHLDIWTQQSDRWIDLGLWDEQAGEPVDEAALAGRVCHGGLDLSAVRDITAWVLTFPHADDPEAIDVLCRFWCPRAWAFSKANRYHAQYQAWAEQGYLALTEGDAIDYVAIEAQVLADAEKFKITDLNIDRLFQGYQTATQLAAEGLEVFPMGQGFLSMAVPMKEFEKRLLKKKIHHGGHPVLRWMADNVVVKQDAAGNLKPDKANSQGRIDGIVSLVMALDRASRHEEHGSVYDDEAERPDGLLMIG